MLVRALTRARCRHEDGRVSRSRILIAAFVALGLGAVSQSRGQVPMARCSATVAGRPSFSVSDLDELQSSRLIATHTLQLTTDFGDTLADDVRFSMPASVTVIRPHGDIDAGPSGLIFFSDRSGAVPVTTPGHRTTAMAGRVRATRRPASSSGPRRASAG
jgi:hypothetical protein